MCAFVVLGLVFPYQAKRLAWGASLKWPILCWVGIKTFTQSINQQCTVILLLLRHSSARNTFIYPVKHRSGINGYKWLWVCNLPCVLCTVVKLLSFVVCDGIVSNMTERVSWSLLLKVTSERFPTSWQRFFIGKYWKSTFCSASTAMLHVPMSRV